MAQAPAGAGGDGGARARLIARSVAVALLLVLVGLDLLIPDPFTFAWRQSFALALAAADWPLASSFFSRVIAGWRFCLRRLPGSLFGKTLSLGSRGGRSWRALARTSSTSSATSSSDTPMLRSSASLFGTAMSAESSLPAATSRTVPQMTSQRRSRACRICGGPQARRRWSLPPIRKADRFRISHRRCRTRRLSLRLQRCRPINNSKPRAEPVSIREGRCGRSASP